MDNQQLAEKYGLTPAVVSSVLSRERKRSQKSQQMQRAPAVQKELAPPSSEVGPGQGIPMDSSALLTQGQRQMLVAEFRAQGKSHKEAVAMAGVSDKGGKNAVRVDREAEPAVTQLVKGGRTSVSDAMAVMKLPADVQNRAAAEVAAGQAKKLATAKAVREYVTGIMPVIEDLSQRQSLKPSEG